MIALNLPPGPVQVVDEEGLHLTTAGWRLVAILQQEETTPVFDQEQPLHVPEPNYGNHISTVMVTRYVVVKKTCFLLHMDQEQADYRAGISAELEKAKIAAVEQRSLAVEAEQGRQKLFEEAATLRRLYASANETVATVQGQVSQLQETLRARTAEIDKLKTTTAVLEWNAVVKAIGADRISQIVGRQVEDPDPLLPEQVPTAYDRLLEEE